MDDHNLRYKVKQVLVGPSDCTVVHTIAGPGSPQDRGRMGEG